MRGDGECIIEEGGGYNLEAGWRVEALGSFTEDDR